MTTVKDDTRREWFRRFRAEWFRMMRPIGAWVPWELRDLVTLDERNDEPAFWAEGLMTRAPQLGPEHLRSCVVVPTRTSMLERLPHGGIVAEVGVLHGRFSREILQVVRPRELHLIDHLIEPGARALAEERPEVVRLHHGDSVTVLSGFPDEYFDWIYIDAQHTYEGVKRDIAAAARKVKSDGLLVFNDYTPWSYVEMQPYGIVAAVNELCTEQDWEFVYLALPEHMYCDAAVRRRSAGSNPRPGAPAPSGEAPSR